MHPTLAPSAPGNSCSADQEFKRPTLPMSVHPILVRSRLNGTADPPTSPSSGCAGSRICCHRRWGQAAPRRLSQRVQLIVEVDGGASTGTDSAGVGPASGLSSGRCGPRYRVYRPVIELEQHLVVVLPAAPRGTDLAVPDQQRLVLVHTATIGWAVPRVSVRHGGPYRPVIR